MRGAVPRWLAFVLAFGLAGAAHATLSVCATNQKAYEVYQTSNNAVIGQGDTPGEACARAISTRELLQATDSLCAYIDRTTTPVTNFTRPIRQVCVTEDPTSLTPNKVQTYLELWAAFLVAGVTVHCLKGIYNRFRIDHD